MKILGIILFVLAAFSFFTSLNMRPPADMAPDEASGYMIGTMILPALFLAAGVWCLWKGVKTARNKRRQAALVQPS